MPHHYKKRKKKKMQRGGGVPNVLGLDLNNDGLIENDIRLQDIPRSMPVTGNRDVDAIIDIESSRRPEAVSKSGFLGAMQLGSSAVKDFNKEFGTDIEFNKQSMFDPKVNIEIGSWYFNERIPELLRSKGIADTRSNRAMAFNGGAGKLKDLYEKYNTQDAGQLMTILKKSKDSKEREIGNYVTKFWREYNEDNRQFEGGGFVLQINDDDETNNVLKTLHRMEDGGTPNPELMYVPMQFSNGGPVHMYGVEKAFLGKVIKGIGKGIGAVGKAIGKGAAAVGKGIKDTALFGVDNLTNLALGMDLIKPGAYSYGVSKGLSGFTGGALNKIGDIAIPMAATALLGPAAAGGVSALRGVTGGLGEGLNFGQALGRGALSGGASFLGSSLLGNTGGFGNIKGNFGNLTSLFKGISDPGINAANMPGADQLTNVFQNAGITENISKPAGFFNRLFSNFKPKELLGNVDLSSINLGGITGGGTPGFMGSAGGTGLTNDQFSQILGLIGQNQGPSPEEIRAQQNMQLLGMIPQLLGSLQSIANAGDGGQIRTNMKYKTGGRVKKRMQAGGPINSPIDFDEIITTVNNNNLLENLLNQAGTLTGTNLQTDQFGNVGGLLQLFMSNILRPPTPRDTGTLTLSEGSLFQNGGITTDSGNFNPPPIKEEKKRRGGRRRQSPSTRSLRRQVGKFLKKQEDAINQYRNDVIDLTYSDQKQMAKDIFNQQFSDNATASREIIPRSGSELVNMYGSGGKVKKNRKKSYQQGGQAVTAPDPLNLFVTDGNFLFPGDPSSFSPLAATDTEVQQMMLDKLLRQMGNPQEPNAPQLQDGGMALQRLSDAGITNAGISPMGNMKFQLPNTNIGVRSSSMDNSMLDINVINQLLDDLRAGKNKSTIIEKARDMGINIPGTNPSREDITGAIRSFTQNQLMNSQINENLNRLIQLYSPQRGNVTSRVGAQINQQPSIVMREQGGSIPVDSRGLYAHDDVVAIPSRDLTFRGIDIPTLVAPIPGTNMVIEKPLAKMVTKDKRGMGGRIKKRHKKMCNG